MGGLFVRFRVIAKVTERTRSPLTARSSRTAILSRSLNASAKRRLLLEHLCERCVLANITGLVFEDTNQSLQFDSGDAPLADRLVYLDSNNNSLIDENESVQMTDADGRFDFADISGDEAIVRLFNGNASAPLPLLPFAPSFDDPAIEFAGATSIASLLDRQLVAIAGDSVIRADVATGNVESISVAGIIRSVQPLPDGRLLVLGSDEVGNESFTIDATGTVTPLILDTADATVVWDDVAIDASGNGVLVERSTEETLLRAIAVGDSIAVGATSTSVGAGTRVYSGGELTSIISTPTDDGIRLRMWSNATGTEIGSGGTEIHGGVEVLSYNDESGLVLVRTTADSVSLLDAASNFASLQSLEVDQLVSIDHDREWLFTISPVDSILRIVDLNSAASIGQFELDAEAISGATELLFDQSTGKLLALTAAGVTPIALKRTGAQRVRLDESTLAPEILFALGPDATPNENRPPKYNEIPSFETFEDVPLVVNSPQLLDGAVDDDGDQFIVILDKQATNGTVVVTPTGGLGYIPLPNFFGTDQFDVVLHDGTEASPPISISITVTPVADALDFSVQSEIIPENAVAAFVAGVINVINVDGGNIVWGLSDPRLIIIGNDIVVAPDSGFDYESEPIIDVEITASNSTSNESVTKTIRFSVGNVEELDVEIQPDFATIDENLPGELIAEIRVIDDGEGAQYAFTIDDDRFVVDFRDLRLKPGISLDYEAETSVTINITAMSASGATKTEPLVITVRDIAEPISSVELDRKEVIELVRGAEVGKVIVDGRPVATGLLVSVDDSRFEVRSGMLKLRDSEFVRRSEQQEIQLVVTVQDASSAFLPVAGTFVIEVLGNSNPFHNEDNPYDVNGDDQVTPLDALLILNSIGRNGGPGPISGFPSPDRFYDVNGDGEITPLDALLIINHLNRIRRASGEGLAPATPLADSPDSGQFGNGPYTPSQSPEGESEERVMDQRAAPGAVLKSKSAVASFDKTELVKLRDQVIKLLATDTISSPDEVDVAIGDFLLD